MTRRQRTPSRAAAELAIAGGTQQQVADALGVDRSYIAHILAGRMKPKPGFDIALRAVVGKEAADLVLEAMKAT